MKKYIVVLMLAIFFVAIGNVDADARTRKKTKKAHTTRTTTYKADLMGNYWTEEHVLCNSFLELNGSEGKLLYYEPESYQRSLPDYIGDTTYRVKVVSKSGKTMKIVVLDDDGSEMGYMEGVFNTWRQYISDYQGTYYHSDGTTAPFLFESYGD